MGESCCGSCVHHRHLREVSSTGQTVLCCAAPPHPEWGWPRVQADVDGCSEHVSAGEVEIEGSREIMDACVRHLASVAASAEPQIVQIGQAEIRAIFWGTLAGDLQVLELPDGSWVMRSDSWPDGTGIDLGTEAIPY
jgi:hypothetical protein